MTKFFIGRLITALIGHLPDAEVEVGAPEAVWVPAGHVGPIVAAPFEAEGFEIEASE